MMLYRHSDTRERETSFPPAVQKEPEANSVLKKRGAIGYNGEKLKAADKTRKEQTMNTSEGAQKLFGGRKKETLQYGKNIFEALTD